MKTDKMTKKISWMAVAGAMLLAGCNDNEAEKFGYKGLDLEESEPMFFSTSPAVTNWVPARVLSVCENYEMSADEQKVLASAGVVAPGEELAEIPAGYAKQDEEPWFTTWTKGGAAFGLEGVAGFISHYDEDRRVWTTSESYFSSYWKTEAEALAALAKLRAAFAEGYGVKKFYDFDRCWVAEYVRLRVMAVVGQKADGRWSCMLDLNDKNRPGCGQWEPVPEQQERRNQYVYTKAMKAWRAEVAKILNDNHARLEKEIAEAGLPGFAVPPSWQMAEVPEVGPCFVGVLEGVFTNTLNEAWSERLAEIKQAWALEPAAEPVEQTGDDGSTYRSLVLSDARYDVRLGAALASEQPAASEASEEAPAAEAAPAAPEGRWRILCFEKLPAGQTLPKRPVLQK